MKLDKKKKALILATILGVIIAFLPPFGGLEKVAMTYLGVFVWTLICLATGALPLEVTILGALCAMLITGVAPFEVLFSQYAGSTTWLLIAVFGFGTAISNSGLLVRLSLYIMRVFPDSWTGKVLSVMVSGAIISPMIPNLSAKAVITIPVAGSIADGAGYEKHSKGQVGLFMGAYLSSCMSGNAYLTGSLMVPLVLTFAAQTGITWFGYFKATWVWLVVVLILSFLYVNFFYNPEKGKGKSAAVKTGDAKAELNARIAALGPISSKEKLAAVVLIASIALWMTESVHGLSTFTVTLLAWLIMSIGGLFTTMDLMTKIAWPVVIMCGGMLTISSLMSTVGISGLISSALGDVLLAMAENPIIMVVGVSLLSTALWSAYVSPTVTMMLIGTLLGPIAAETGFNLLIPVFVCAMSAQQWIYPSQSSSLLAAFGVAGGRVEHKDTLHANWAWIVIQFIACVASVPWWTISGML